MSQWHPDKLETMAPELKDYATRQTQRINEAYQMLKTTAVQQ
jgi:curved DNA-binding protein CbpA